MKRALSCLLLLSVPYAAAAAPSFKTAPNSEKAGGEAEEAGGWGGVVPDAEAVPPWLQEVLGFLANNYGYLGVAAVLLMLVIFARGSRDDAEAEPAAGGDDDDFFEPGDADRYGGHR